MSQGNTWYWHCYSLVHPGILGQVPDQMRYHDEVLSDKVTAVVAFMHVALMMAHKNRCAECRGFLNYDADGFLSIISKHSPEAKKTKGASSLGTYGARHFPAFFCGR